MELECDRQGVGRMEPWRGRQRIAAWLPANHLITDELPGTDHADEAAGRLSNSDPITGQAAWYDVRVRIYAAEADAKHTLPQFETMHALPGSNGVISRIVQTYFAGQGKFAARLRGAVGRK